MPTIKWDLNKIRYGLEEFYKLNKRYPLALEIDRYPLLPSSRQVQRKFGGLKELRRFLNDDIVGQTYALDMLYTPKEFWITSSPIWESVIKKRSRFKAR